MTDNIKLYKEISLKILYILEKEELEELDQLLDERQVILDKESHIEEFKKNLIEDGILEIDKKIHVLLNENINKVKKEIKEHRMSKQANNSYVNFNREKLNIFDKKV